MKNLTYLPILICVSFIAFQSASNPENDSKILNRSNRIYNLVASNSEIAISILSTEQIPSNENNYSIIYYKKGSSEILKLIEVENNKLKVKRKNVKGFKIKLSTTVDFDSLNEYCCEFLDDSYMGHKYEDYFVFKISINGKEKVISIYKQQIRENADDYKYFLDLLNLLETEYSGT